MQYDADESGSLHPSTVPVSADGLHGQVTHCKSLVDYSQSELHLISSCDNLLFASKRQKKTIKLNYQ